MSRFAGCLALAIAVGACGGPAHISGACDGPCPQSRVRHLVVIVQENHTFDDHFGRYCTAPSPSPDCNDGPDCCEPGPDHEPGGAAPVVLDDDEHGSYDPDHTRACESQEIDGGLMDKFVTANCSAPDNFAYADPSLVQPLWQLAAGGALADRYFQPVVGQSSANDMYLWRARWTFDDDLLAPNAIGHECSFIPTQMSFDGPSLPDLLDTAGVSFAWYADGYQLMKDARAKGECPEAPADCAFGLSVSPCVYDPADISFNYEARFADDPKHLRDFSQLAGDLAAGKLPQVVFVKPVGYHSEHPGLRTKLSVGVNWAVAVVDALEKSAYRDDTLVLLTYDEGGGYFDHVPPPPDSAADGQPYGTRVPTLALGPFARVNYVSHVTLEHSSIVKLIEWNWLKDTGQLAARDGEVNNLGSLLDPALGIPVD